ncbi:hypothetical protein [Yinghuangia seranimata]|nr:hypothetical protein [Yinghuangia seranimata]MDI2131339.1 hypothetical protein [Yinghuangia seranimata]
MPGRTRQQPRADARPPPACLGIPLLAVAAGWTIAGREPASITRRLLE